MSSDPGVYNGMTIFRGLTFSKVFTLKNADGTLVDLTGWTGEFKAKASVDSATNVIDLTAEPGIIMGGTEGTISIEVSDAQTDAITDCELVYSLTITNGTEVNGLLVGVMPVSNKALP